MRKKIIAILTLCMMLFTVFILVACNDAESGEGKSCEAMIYNINRIVVKDDFLNKNRTYGAYYLNSKGETVQDTTSPETRTFVISNEKDHNKILSGGVDGVDFNKEVIIVYLFTDTHHSEIPYWLTDASVKGRVLKIGLALHQVPRVEDYTVPAYQRSIVVRMEKVAFKSVEFYEVTENTNPKNAVLYDDDVKRKWCDLDSYFRQDFWEENKVYGAYYHDKLNVGYWDTTSPSTRTHIVTNQAEYDKIFSDFIDVDFEKETLVVHVFADNNLRYSRITDIVLESGKLQINYTKQDFPDVADSVWVYQRCFVLKMEKTEFDSIEFKKTMEYYELAYN